MRVTSKSDCRSRGASCVAANWSRRCSSGNEHASSLTLDSHREPATEQEEPCRFHAHLPSNEHAKTPRRKYPLFSHAMNWEWFKFDTFLRRSFSFPPERQGGSWNIPGEQRVWMCVRGSLDCRVSLKDTPPFEWLPPPDWTKAPIKKEPRRQQRFITDEGR